MSCSCKEITKKSIMEIFNDMVSCDRVTNWKLQNCDDCLKADKATDIMENFSELSHILKRTAEPKLLNNAVEDAAKALNKWKNSSSLKRADSLHKIWQGLQAVSKSVSKSKNELLTLISYFDFYADLTVHTEEYRNWRSCGIILIVLSNSSPFFILGATVPPALAAGCSVIVLVPEKIKNVSLFLEEIIIEAGLPDGLLNTVTDFHELDHPLCKEINKIFFCGSYLSAVKLYTRNVTKLFNFFCPGNTTAFILESGDLDAAVDKIVTETFVKNSLFSVSNIVVQESVYKNFLKKLKYRLQQFMITNKSSLEMKNKTTEKLNELTTTALSAGEFFEKYGHYENEITQPVIESNQNDDIVEAITTFKIQPCRTAKEGVALLKNCQYSLGTSIWSEISSQALEISSMLSCPNIWINNHGMFEAGEPFQLLGFSGNCVLGGSDGVFGYFSCSTDHVIKEKESNEDEMLDTKKLSALQVAVSAQSAFNIWQRNKNRRQFLKYIAGALEESEELSKLSETVSSFAHIGNLTTSSQRVFQEYLLIKRKIPVGVFLLIVNTTSIDITSFASLITPIIAFGNGVIVIFREINPSVKGLIKKFTEVLPKNLFNVMVGIKNGIYLASDPHIQAIWVYDESAVSVEFLQTIKNHSARSLKNIWVIPKIFPTSQQFFQKECLRNQVIWLTNTDMFP